MSKTRQTRIFILLTLVSDYVIIIKKAKEDLNMKQKKNKILHLAVIFMLLFTATGGFFVFTGLIPINKSLAEAKTKSKKKMPRFNPKLLAKEKKERAKLIKKYKLDDETIKKVDKYIKKFILRTRHFISFRQGLEDLNIIDENAKLIKKHKIIIGNDSDEELDFANNDNTLTATNSGISNAVNKVKHKRPPVKEYIVTRVHSGIYSSFTIPQTPGKPYKGGGMRPDGKIYDAEVITFSSNVSYLRIYRRLGKKLILKTYYIDKSKKILVPMNYIDIVRKDNKFYDSGLRMWRSYPPINHSYPGKDSNVFVTLSGSIEYTIRGVKKPEK